MKKILFVCYGNICRSPMAMFIMRDLSKKYNLNLVIESRATSREEIGNDMYYLSQQKLKEKGIPFTSHRACQIINNDLVEYDLIYCMEQSNINDLKRIFVGKDLNNVYLLDDAGIADPWYSRNFEVAYSQIYAGCLRIINDLREGII